MQEQEVIITHHQNDPHQKAVQSQPTADDFLENYEIKTWEFTPRFYKILAASAIFNLLLIAVFAQTNILQARACDSPWVGRVCQVLDTVYLGSAILSNDSEFVTRPYEKTEIEDAEIVWINQTGTEPLNYPEGYFAVANPESQYMNMTDPMMSNSDFPGFAPLPPSSVPPMASTPNMVPPPAPMPMPISPSPSVKLPPQRLPRASKNKIDIPDSLITNDDLSEVNSPSGKSKKDEKPKADETAKNDTKKPEENDSKQPEIGSLPVAEEVINKKPLLDFSDGVLEKVSKKEVDLTKPFSVTMVGTITKDGKFDRKKSAFLKLEGDESMINVAKSAIEAIGDSGLLTYLKTLNVDAVKVELVQDDKNIYAVITSDQKSEQSAKSVTSGLNSALSIGKMTVSEPDTLSLINAATVESKGKNFVLNFKLDKPVAHEMINRQLQKAEQNKNKQQPNSTAQNKNTNEKNAE